MGACGRKPRRDGVLRQRGRRGFTLVELMITMAIIGVLSSLGMQTFKRYKLRAVQAEVFGNLKRIYEAQAAYYDTPQIVGSGTNARERNHCIVTQGANGAGIDNPDNNEFIALLNTWIPKTWPTSKARTYDFSQHAGFRALGFTIDGPFYANYWFSGSIPGLSTQHCNLIDTDDENAISIAGVTDLDENLEIGVASISARAKGGELLRTRAGIYTNSGY